MRGLDLRVGISCLLPALKPKPTLAPLQKKTPEPLNLELSPETLEALESARATFSRGNPRRLTEALNSKKAPSPKP